MAGLEDSQKAQPPMSQSELARMFPETLAAAIGSLAQQLAEEHERELARAHEAELLQLRAENSKLSKALASLEGARHYSDPRQKVDCNKAIVEACRGQEDRPMVVTNDVGERDMSRKVSYETDFTTTNSRSSSKSGNSNHRNSVDSQPTLSADRRTDTEDFLAQTVTQRKITADAVDLWEQFKHLDQGHKGYLDANDLMTIESTGDTDFEPSLDTMARLIQVVNCELQFCVEDQARFMGYQAPDIEKVLSFMGFQAMIFCKDDLLGKMDEHLASALTHIRKCCVEHQTNTQIAKVTNVSQTDLTRGKKRTRARDLVLSVNWLEPAVAIHVLINSLLIGVSLDLNSGWPGWQWLEGYFTTWFLFELLIKLRMKGCAEHFLGIDWAWNLFDFTIVTLALVDLLTTIVSIITDRQGSLDFSRFTLIRLARLIRIARVVRLLRLQIFKELTLMVNGVIGGLKTLIWAIVLLGVLIYILAVLMRQIMEKVPESCATTCTWAEDHVIEHRYELFGSVPRSMFTVFRCFTDGCASPDGIPLILPLWDYIGWVFVLGYVLSFLFVSIGVFNLIMAIFVENTLEYARQNDEKRNALAYKEHVRVAQNLRDLVLQVCSSASSARVTTSRSSSGSRPDPEAGLRGSMKAVMDAMRTSEQRKRDTMNSPAHNQMRVTRQEFEEALQNKKVQQLLDEMEISISSRDKLFEILDSDGNGFLAVSEMTEGFMRLRGPADKGDIVKTSLMLRSMQKGFKTFQVAVLRNQEDLKKFELDVLRNQEVELLHNQQALISRLDNVELFLKSTNTLKSSL